MIHAVKAVREKSGFEKAIINVNFPLLCYNCEFDNMNTEACNIQTFYTPRFNQANGSISPALSFKRYYFISKDNCKILENMFGILKFQ
jgi:hypothetical protein